MCRGGACVWVYWGWEGGSVPVFFWGGGRVVGCLGLVGRVPCLADRSQSQSNQNRTTYATATPCHAPTPFTTFKTKRLSDRKQVARLISPQARRLVAAIAPQAQAVAAAFGIPDYLVAAPIAGNWEFYNRWVGGWVARFWGRWVGAGGLECCVLCNVCFPLCAVCCTVAKKSVPMPVPVPIPTTSPQRPNAPTPQHPPTPPIPPPPNNPQHTRFDNQGELIGEAFKQL